MHGKKEPKSEIYKKKPKNGIYTPDGFHPSLPASEVDWGYIGRWGQNLRGVFVWNIADLASFASQNPVQQRCLVLSPRLREEEKMPIVNIIMKGSTNPGFGDMNCHSFWHFCFNVIWSRRGIVSKTWFTSRHRSWKASATWVKVGTL